MLTSEETLSFSLLYSAVLPCRMLYIYLSFLTFASIFFLLDSVMMPLSQTHTSSVEVQLRPSPSLTYQNLKSVTLTHPSELTMPLPAIPTRLPSEHFCLLTPDLVPLSSPLQMPPLSLGLSQPEESDEHIAKLLEMVTVGLNILPTVTMEGNSSMHPHLDHKLEKSAAVANLPASYLCLLGHNLGAMGSATTSRTSEQREAGTKA